MVSVRDGTTCESDCTFRYDRNDAVTFKTQLEMIFNHKWLLESSWAEKIDGNFVSINSIDIIGLNSLLFLYAKDFFF